jgi:putative intracellular protease/amidase
MKKVIFLFLISIMLGACSTAPEIVPTETPIPSTVTPEPTATVIKPKVLVFIRDGSYLTDWMMEEEVGVILSMLEEAGILAVVSTQSEDSYKDANPPLKSDILLKDVNVADFDGFLLPCMAAGDPEFIDDDAVVMVAEAAAQNKPIAAQHGSIPTLAKAGVLEGKNYAYTREVFKEGTYIGSGVVQDGNIITSSACPREASQTNTPAGTSEMTQLLIEAVLP